MHADEFGFGTQIRKSPYFDATVRWGAKGFSVYNHMYIPRDFGDPEQNFWNLVNDAILCDVAVERQVEITGPDAAKFVQMLTPRNLSKMAVGQCKYVLITNAQGGILNDPILLRLAENHFWISLADSDILLWAQGVAVHSGLDVQIGEPDVSPLQLQGPQSGEVMRALFGDSIMDLKYYWLREMDLDGIPLIVSAALLSFAHGANDVANAVGPLAAIVQASSTGDFTHAVEIPLWVMVIGALGISFGLFLFGPKLIRMVGNQITKLNPMRAYCVALSAAITVIVASWLGLPVSSTHIAVGGVFGVGFFREWDTERRMRKSKLAVTGLPALPPEERRRRKLVRRSHFMTVIAAWVITVPAAALMSGVIFLILNALAN